MNELLDRFFLLEANVEDLQKKLLHFKSIRNFIFHYQNVRKEKIKATKLLEEYFDFVESREYKLTVSESDQLFWTCVNQLGMTIYRRHFAFTTYLTLDMIVVYSLCFNGLIALINFDSLVLRVSGWVVTLIYWSRYVYKVKTKRVFGYCY